MRVFRVYVRDPQLSAIASEKGPERPASGNGVSTDRDCIPSRRCSNAPGRRGHAYQANPETPDNIIIDEMRLVRSRTSWA